MPYPRSAIPTPADTNWYRLSVEETFRLLGSSQEGLTSEQAAAGLARFGPNELLTARPSAFLRFVRQFHNPLVYILLAAAAVTGALSLGGEDMAVDTAVILGVVIMNALLGFFQEGKTEAALEALQGMMVTSCTVKRDGREQEILTRELVPGDVVLLNEGDKVPADLRLFCAKNAHADESLLTGESIPVRKRVEAVDGTHLAPADQGCIAFSGTFVTRGTAHGVVTRTAEDTEFGKIARLVRQTEKAPTPLQRKITAFTKVLMIGILGLGALNFALGYAVGFQLTYSFMASVSLIVAAIPEMLPMLVTSILALAAGHMAHRNALIRRLPAAETLGCTTVICSDKTGTLTKNEMTVCRIAAGGVDYKVSGVGFAPDGNFSRMDGSPVEPSDHPALRETIVAGIQCNDAHFAQSEEGLRITGDPTESALLVSAVKAKLIDRHPRVDTIPFESRNMYMATLHEGPEGKILYAKGSPERLVAMCSKEFTGNGLQPIEAGAILNSVEDMANDSLRVLGMASKPLPPGKESIDSDDLYDLTFLGLQAMIDPPRPEAVVAVAQNERAGVHTVMITGDHGSTAVAIAGQLGILKGDDRRVLVGEQIARMSPDDLARAVDEIAVYARVAPEHKLQICQHFQARGDVVAMTGDGVNDAPALKAANIGVSMGIAGTEVSKEAADMVLTDDNFASIVAAVEEGRHAWNNIEKAILYTLPTNGGQALLVMGALLTAPFVALFATRLPLEPIQILWINLFDSVFLTMPLMLELKEKGLLDRGPRSARAEIADATFFRRVGIVSLVMAAMGFATYWRFGHDLMEGGAIDLAAAQTATLTSVVMVHLGYLFTARSTRASAFTFSPFGNRWLLAGAAATVLFNLAMVYSPLMNSLFRTAPFPTDWWAFVALGLPAGFLVPELEKAIVRWWSRRKARRSRVR
jgi:magnesium-transporting ATPase (P-type)